MHSFYRPRQPILADEVQTFKALITVHKVLQEGHPIAVKEAQANINWLESLTRGVSGEGLRGMDQDPGRRGVETDHESIGAAETNKFTDLLDRIWAFVARLCLLPSGEASVPQAASRVQRYGKPKRRVVAHGLISIAGLFEYEEYISLKSINDPNEG